MQRLLHTKTTLKDYSQGEDLFASESRYPWILTKEGHDLVVVMPNKMIRMDENGDYHTYDKEGNMVKNDTSELSLLLQVLTETKRFIAD